ncbi:MAG: TetR/AcrR family transcriptional regulator [Actinomycetota bacterium]|nr:TetR/AcrR family transcriptional regulator [Actinomycetota bacterium]
MTEATDTRAAQRRATRDRIVRAVADLVTEEHPAAFSVPAVAKRAGVGVATVYRYFPTKEALLDAASLIGAEDSREAFGDAPSTFDELGELLPAYWHEVASKHLGLARNQIASPVGRELRRRRWETKRNATQTALRQRGIDPDSAEGRRLEAVADVLTSSTALLELHDKAGIPVDQAAAHVLWALEVLVASTEAHTRSNP